MGKVGQYGDNAAAMRYTEARMSKISMTLLEDIEKQLILAQILMSL